MRNDLCRVCNALLLIGLLALNSCAIFGREKPYQETSGKRGWHPFLRPAEKNPAAQLVLADQLRQAGRVKKAMKQYAALTVYWPESREAASAQYQYAKIWDSLGKEHRAFDEYQRLFKTGAALDLLLGTDPKADMARRTPGRGDLRLLIAWVDGKPQVVLYQPVAPGARPDEAWVARTEAGGETRFDRVVLLNRAEVALKGESDFTVEAAIPLADLGLKIQPGLELAMDWGVLTSADGHQVKERLYWANTLATGTSDEAVEARLEPHLWGRLRFTGETAVEDALEQAAPSAIDEALDLDEEP